MADTETGARARSSRRIRHGSRTRSAIFAPLEDVGRAVRIEQRLASAIRSGLLQDGERLPSEPELASMMGVATVTAREALVALRAQGLVTTVRGRNGGSYVNRPKSADDDVATRLAAMSRVELHDRAAVQLVLLTGCAEVAADRADPDDVDLLSELVPAADEEDTTVWRHAEAEFFLSLAALTQSARLTREMVRLESDFGHLARHPLGSPEVRAHSRQCLLALLDALRAHDGEAARAAVRAHAGRTLDELSVLQAAAR
ncbi:DNA-binding FadR family transcriptional regulator [Nocardioides thalensis]|uniref:DNA-binding FadR family transcriptional regulator n=1 Tax=Nocardioides thalensis TaxID=1914755 RepID=A0A853C0U2_9ACTN|nr:DNA-binding FadR family transcriptional regulator [Nocardioides thalensis]